MELKDVAIFAQVMSEGDFSSAARALSLKPSTVSKAISRLEADLGHRLFDRSSRSMKLTPEGDRFGEAAARLLAAADDARSVLTPDDPRGILRVRSMPTFARHQLAPLMPDFLRRYPHLDLIFLLGNDGAVPLSGGADVAIVSGELTSSNLVARKIATSRWIICASPAYVAHNGTPTGPKDLSHHQCLNFAIPTLWNDWSRNAESHRRVAADNGDMLRALALSGCGIVRLAEFHISADLTAGRLVEVLPDPSPCAEPIYILYREKRLLSPRIRVLIDYLAEALVDAPWATRQG
ncbi:MAG: transcriptional regulator, LysR family [Sphingomonadales bacterium]|nr:transcriptional regulator, LysR family [Sphingomonadales bacterium]